MCRLLGISNGSNDSKAVIVKIEDFGLILTHFWSNFVGGIDTQNSGDTLMGSTFNPWTFMMDIQLLWYRMRQPIPHLSVNNNWKGTRIEVLVQRRLGITNKQPNHLQLIDIFSHKTNIYFHRPSSECFWTVRVRE